MKSYTDIEQSKKLAEILPLESSDMIYIPMMDIDSMSNSGFFNIPECYPFNEFKDSDTKPLPCWSLAALLNVIKPINENTYTIRGTLDGGATISFDEITSVMFQEEEIIDAVFEMVVWLKENKKL